MGFHIDACAPGHKEGKGKVEAKVRLSRLRLDPTGRAWSGLEELQAHTDQRLETWAKWALCPATGGYGANGPGELGAGAVTSAGVARAPRAL